MNPTRPLPTRPLPIVARPVLETMIKHDILEAIGAELDLFIIVNAVGRAEHVDQATDRRYTVPYGLGVGSPDLVGMLEGPDGHARWFCLEVKRPGEHPTDAQRKSHAMWRARGALIYVVTSVADAQAALATARRAIRSPRFTQPVAPTRTRA